MTVDKAAWLLSCDCKVLIHQLENINNMYIIYWELVLHAVIPFQPDYWSEQVWMRHTAKQPISDYSGLKHWEDDRCYN